MLAQLISRYPQDVRLVYRHFPLMSIHDKAALAAQAAEAAGEQGKFWEMHDLLFEQQSTWSGLSISDFEGWLIDQTTKLGLDQDKFTNTLKSDGIVKLAQKAWEDGQSLGIPYTPFLIVDGQVWSSDVPANLANLSTVVELTLLETRQYTMCPPMIIDPLKQYLVTLHTAKGEIVIQLFAEKAPLAVNNFVFLARDGWYDGVTFHRVLPGFVAQAGDPTGTGFGGPGYAFVNETSADLKFDRAGLVAMANAGPDTNGSQFFITFASAPQLDGGYTIFGQVVQGMDVATSLTPRDPSQGGPPGDVVQSMTIEEK